MCMETRSTDAKGRICLPKAFANATVIIEQVSDTEVRIRKAVVIPEDDISFYEETAPPLSDRDRDSASSGPGGPRGLLPWGSHRSVLALSRIRLLIS